MLLHQPSDGLPLDLRAILYPENAFERVHVQLRLGQQALELGALCSELARPLGD